MPSEFKKRARGPEGPSYVIVATEEQKWVNREFLWRMIARSSKNAHGARGAHAKTQGRKGGSKGAKKGSRKDARTRRGKEEEGGLGTERGR